MKGYKTWVGIIVAILGALGISDILGAENIEGILNAILQVIGFALAMYGNYKAHQEIKVLGALRGPRH